LVGCTTSSGACSTGGGASTAGGCNLRFHGAIARIGCGAAV
jgi:hypothetical protein